MISMRSFSRILDCVFHNAGAQIVLNGPIGDQLRTQAVADAAGKSPFIRVRDALMGTAPRKESRPHWRWPRPWNNCVPRCRFKNLPRRQCEVRAERRYLEIIESGQTVERSAILRDLENRDVRDRTRKVAPLVPANDAYMIDSSDKTAAQVAADIRDLCQANGLA